MRKLQGLAFLIFVVTAYENCAPPSATTTNSSSTAVLTLSDTNVLKIQADPLLTQSPFSVIPTGNAAHTPPLLVVDFTTSVLTFRSHQTGLSSTCQTNDSRLTALLDLVQHAQICTTKPTPGTINCMAIPANDIEIDYSPGTTNTNLPGVVQLSKPICNQGVSLCGADDDELRRALTDLTLHPPANCSLP